MITRLTGFLSLLLIAFFATESFADDQVLEKAKSADSEPIRLYESFEKKLKLDWKPIRESKSHWSLTKHPGQLTIITQRGSIHGDEKKDEFGGGIQAKNLFLIENPLKETDGFVLTTCLLDFKPTTHWQQAGLLLYNDDDNYAKLVFENNGRGLSTTVLTEIDKGSTITGTAFSKDAEKLYLRIERSKRKYTAKISTDGMEYTDIHTFEWLGKSPVKFGLIAKNGGNPDAAEIEAVFDFFELRPPYGD